MFVVGGTFPNRDGSSRRFETLLCAPGEPVTLRREPKNPADGNAVAVDSARGVQIGYLAAERAPWIAAKLDAGRTIRAVFQQPTRSGAVIRADLDGEEPALPRAANDAQPAPRRRASASASAGGDGFWPDPTYDD